MIIITLLSNSVLPVSKLVLLRGQRGDLVDFAARAEDAEAADADDESSSSSDDDNDDA